MNQSILKLIASLAFSGFLVLGFYSAPVLALGSTDETPVMCPAPPDGDTMNAKKAGDDGADCSCDFCCPAKDSTEGTTSFTECAPDPNATS